MVTKFRTLVTKNFIDGTWISSTSGDFMEVVSPIDGKVIGDIQMSNELDVDLAVKSATNALNNWNSMSSPSRGDLLHKAAELLVENGKEIAEIASKEMGKRYVDTYGEITRGAELLRYYAQDAWRSNGEVLPSVNNKKLLYTKRVPVGVVGVISPWNFPIAIPIWKIAPALAYGNTIVFKPAAETSISAMKIVEVFEKAGLPKGVINLVTGKGTVVGNSITNHKGVSAITFTGSNSVGKTIANMAVKRGAKYQLELGGKNPTIVLNDADVKLAAKQVIESAMKQQGQRCTATSRVYIQSEIYDEFKAQVLEYVKKLKVGNSFDNDVDMGPLASKKALQNVLSYIEKGKEEGATLLIGGNRLTEGDLGEGCFFAPTIFENVTNEMTIAKEEIFGPVLALLKVDSYEEALIGANDTIYGLSASIYTNDIATALDFVERSEVGLVQVNSETGGTELQAPFGGAKESSSGSREQGQAAKEFFTNYKTVSITPLTKG